MKLKSGAHQPVIDSANQGTPIGSSFASLSQPISGTPMGYPNISKLTHAVDIELFVTVTVSWVNEFDW